jgi:DNA-binding response OmpR family regulator
VRILVVEDDEHLGRAIRRGLEAEGFATDLARDGVDGLWQARECDYGEFDEVEALDRCRW